MSNNVNAAGNQLAQTLDSFMGFGTRALEGFYNFKLLNTELRAREADAQWRLANNNMLYGQSIGNGGSPYGVTGVNGIPSTGSGYTAAGFGIGNSSQVGIVIAIAVGLGLLFFKKD